MYKRYSQGLVAELGSHQTSLAEWYLGSTARSVYGSGGIYCYKDGREVNDHIFMTFDHPGGCTVELSVILSNSYGGLYEEFVGSNGTLIISDQDGGMFFPKEKGCPVGDPIKGIDETIPWKPSWEVGFRMEVWAFAMRSGARACLGCERPGGEQGYCYKNAGRDFARVRTSSVLATHRGRGSSRNTKAPVRDSPAA
jgi:predicted dehydrogenase